MSIRRCVDWTLLVVAIIAIMSGLGITEFRVMERLTFGALSKIMAFRVHFAIWKPFLVLLVMHLVLRGSALALFRKARKRD